jgi:hypothetical protein
MTTQPPLTRTAPVVTAPSTLWYIGRQLMRSLGPVLIMLANQWVQVISSLWLMSAPSAGRSCRMCKREARDCRR